MAKITLGGRERGETYSIILNLPDSFLARTTGVGLSAWLDVQKYKIIDLLLREEGRLYDSVC